MNEKSCESKHQPDILKEIKRKELSKRLRTIIGNKKCVYKSIMNSRRIPTSKRSKNRHDEVVLKKLMKFGKSHMCKRQIFPEAFKKDVLCRCGNTVLTCTCIKDDNYMFCDDKSDDKSDDKELKIDEIPYDTDSFSDKEEEEVCSDRMMGSVDTSLFKIDNVRAKQQEMPSLMVSFTCIQTGFVRFVSPITANVTNLLEVYDMETGNIVYGLKGHLSDVRVTCKHLCVHNMYVHLEKFTQILVGVFSNDVRPTSDETFSIIAWDITDASENITAVCITDNCILKSSTFGNSTDRIDDIERMTDYDIACLLRNKTNTKPCNNATIEPFYVTDIYNDDYTQCIGALIVYGHSSYCVGFGSGKRKRRKKICLLSSTYESNYHKIAAPVTCANGKQMICKFDATTDTITLENIVSNRGDSSCDITNTIKYTIATTYMSKMLKPVLFIDLGDYICPRRPNECMFGVVIENESGCGVDVWSIKENGMFTCESGFVVCDKYVEHSRSAHDTTLDYSVDMCSMDRTFCLHATTVPGTIACTIAVLVQHNSKRIIRVWERVGLGFLCIFEKDVTCHTNQHTQTFELYVSPKDGLIYSAFRNGTNILRLNIL